MSLEDKVQEHKAYTAMERIAKLEDDMLNLLRAVNNQQESIAHLLLLVRAIVGTPEGESNETDQH